MNNRGHMHFGVRSRRHSCEKLRSQPSYQTVNKPHGINLGLVE